MEDITPAGSVDLPVLIVSFRAVELLQRCLESVKTFHPGHDVLIWDNSGPEVSGVRQLARIYPEFSWHFSERNIGFAAAVNRLADMIPGRSFLLLNPDAELVAPLPKTLNSLNDPRVAAAGPMVIPEGYTNPAAIPRRVSRFHQGMTPWDVANKKVTLLGATLQVPGLSRLRGGPFSPKYAVPEDRVTGYIIGSCLAINRDAWDQLGGFNEDFFLYAEEKEWQYRAVRAGWGIRLADECVYRHVGKGSVGEDRALRQRSEDLQFASGIHHYEVTYGRRAADLYLAWLLLRRAIRRWVCRQAAPLDDLGDVMVTAAGPTQRVRASVATALALDQAGHRVTVVSLQRLGILPAELPPSIRLVRVVWWWPWLPGARMPAAVISGHTRPERVLVRLLRMRGTARDAPGRDVGILRREPYEGSGSDPITAPPPPVEAPARPS